MQLESMPLASVACTPLVCAVEAVPLLVATAGCMDTGLKERVTVTVFGLPIRQLWSVPGPT